MAVRVTKRFDGVFDGGVYPTAYAPGDVIDGAAADFALARGCGEVVDPSELPAGPVEPPAGVGRDDALARVTAERDAAREEVVRLREEMAQGRAEQADDVVAQAEAEAQRILKAATADAEKIRAEAEKIRAAAAAPPTRPARRPVKPSE